MLGANSRYAKVPQVTVTRDDGTTVTALMVRRIPAPAASANYTVAYGDRVDILAQQRCGDGSQFWKVADANTELEAADLTAEPGREIQVPVS